MPTQLQHIMFHQGQCCFFCNRLIPEGEASVEHLVPSSAGGSDHPDNLVACCKTLNANFGSMNVKDKIRVILKQNGKFLCPNQPLPPQPKPKEAVAPPPRTQPTPPPQQTPPVQRSQPTQPPPPPKPVQPPQPPQSPPAKPTQPVQQPSQPPKLSQSLPVKPTQPLQSPQPSLSAKPSQPSPPAKPAPSDSSDAKWPVNHGKSWTTVEDQQLIDAFDAKKTIPEIAKEHERGVGGVQARLTKLGKIPPQEPIVVQDLLK